MSRKYLAIADSQAAYCDICRGRGYLETATCCVKYETDMADPPLHIRSGSWCTACATDVLALLGGTDKDHRHQILREKPKKYVIRMDHEDSSYYCKVTQVAIGNQLITGLTWVRLPMDAARFESCEDAELMIFDNEFLWSVGAQSILES
ncbi:hypothetical protein LC605_20780 [Nostoc sp. CHAB 5836]|uniref:hypothetical protein n=1 Tax=Nostoc sp. CHAB 5836 TaxID=2780404 RepID=UPI001E5F90E6|nr:hypothetical protein [Nostoc sp. CHAB 5836]MCC5617477.1 hypothetical protein [Nostoc sp. CHAB 5836]